MHEALGARNGLGDRGQRLGPVNQHIDAITATRRRVGIRPQRRGLRGLEGRELPRAAQPTPMMEAHGRLQAVAQRSVEPVERVVEEHAPALPGFRRDAGCVGDELV